MKDLKVGAARAGALCLSIGIVSTMMVRAGGLGCSSTEETAKQGTPSITAEEPSAVAPSADVAATAPTSSASAVATYDIQYFPGTKSAPFRGVPADLGSSSAKSEEGLPRKFFPGTKSGDLGPEQP